MTATFSYQPAMGARQSIKPAVQVVKFGDGYEQRIGHAINNDPQVWALEFTVNATDAAAIKTFLKTQGAQTAFYWTPPGESQGTYVCREWTPALIGYDIWRINATFEEVFE